MKVRLIVGLLLVCALALVFLIALHQAYEVAESKPPAPGFTPPSLTGPGSSIPPGPATPRGNIPQTPPSHVAQDWTGWLKSFTQAGIPGACKNTTTQPITISTDLKRLPWKCSVGIDVVEGEVELRDQKNRKVSIKAGERGVQRPAGFEPYLIRALNPSTVAVLTFTQR